MKNQITDLQHTLRFLSIDQVVDTLVIEAVKKDQPRFSVKYRPDDYVTACPEVQLNFCKQKDQRYGLQGYDITISKRICTYPEELCGVNIPGLFDTLSILDRNKGKRDMELQGKYYEVKTKLSHLFSDVEGRKWLGIIMGMGRLKLDFENWHPTMQYDPVKNQFDICRSFGVDNFLPVGQAIQSVIGEVEANSPHLYQGVMMKMDWTTKEPEILVSKHMFADLAPAVSQFNEVSPIHFNTQSLERLGFKERILHCSIVDQVDNAWVATKSFGFGNTKLDGSKNVELHMEVNQGKISNAEFLGMMKPVTFEESENIKDIIAVRNKYQPWKDPPFPQNHYVNAIKIKSIKHGRGI